MVQRIYNYSGLPGPAPAPAPVVPAPAPTTPAPATVAPWMKQADAEGWWRQRGGHQLYDLFNKIYSENQLAGRAFWNAVVGRGRGENDLQAATIHKMFGGDMNAYNNWRNAAHQGGFEGMEGSFDLLTGKWNPGAGFNSQYLAERGVTSPGAWAYNGNWNDFKNTFGVGLQSTPGNEEAGAEAWKTYGYNPTFGPNGVTYPSPYEQAVGSGIIAPNPAITSPTPAAPRTTPNPYTLNQQRVVSPTPAITAPAPTPPTAPATPVNPYPTTPVNPHGSPRGYQYNPSRR